MLVQTSAFAVKQLVDFGQEAGTHFDSRVDLVPNGHHCQLLSILGKHGQMVSNSLVKLIHLEIEGVEIVEEFGKLMGFSHCFNHCLGHARALLPFGKLLLRGLDGHAAHQPFSDAQHPYGFLEILLGKSEHGFGLISLLRTLPSTLVNVNGGGYGNGNEDAEQCTERLDPSRWIDFLQRWKRAVAMEDRPAKQCSIAESHREQDENVGMQLLPICHFYRLPSVVKCALTGKF